MIIHQLVNQLWRYRVTSLLLTLGVTCLLISVGTYLLQHSSRHAHHKGWNKKLVKDRAPAANPGSSRHDSSYPQRSEAHPSNDQAPKDGSLYSIMRPRTQTPPVVFLKTHKTGSSTVQNLLFRMGERDRATFAFPHHSYQFNYPDKFRAKFVDELPDGSFQFDLLCSNMRLDIDQLKQVMPKNTIFITILREPLRTFESVFSYYSSSVPAFILAKKVAEMTGHKSALSLFLESPEAFWDPKEPGNSLGKNPMSFDLGLDGQRWNSTWRTDLALLEETFQLVMIAEHFDESLILLGSLLNLDMEELAYVRLNTRSPQSVIPLDDGTKDQISSWNTLDVLLYDFFLQIFLEKVEKHGLERLNSEVALLRATTNRIRRKCLARTGVHPEELEDLVRPWQTDTVTILGYQIQKNLTRPEQGFCTRLVLPELQYHAHLYFQQYGRDMRAVPTE
ncbi:galactose-3-O-sulfotransferase 2 [Cheilinus undulatus]|uniref:galactose-3-O-sulfotransferase 2 n=1 Tax=Cheilinus undulatus TaxID=241271 RepID=UPI001BD57B22|nr:galactose-3-O-sulfotransferase 2 [Cheilinus undulatus]